MATHLKNHIYYLEFLNTPDEVIYDNFIKDFKEIYDRIVNNLQYYEIEKFENTLKHTIKEFKKTYD